MMLLLVTVHVRPCVTQRLSSVDVTRSIRPMDAALSWCGVRRQSVTAAVRRPAEPGAMLAPVNLVQLHILVSRPFSALLCNLIQGRSQRGSRFECIQNGSRHGKEFLASIKGR